MKKMKMTDVDFAQLAKVLRKVDFFAPLTIGQLEMVLPYIMLYAYDTGERICRQGEKGDAFFIIRDGKVDVNVKKGFFSFSKRVATLGQGSFFGETALVTDEPRNATVACAEPSRVFVLTSADFGYVLKKNPQFAAEIKRVAERRKFLLKHKE